jgi:hypothetical protein
MAFDSTYFERGLFEQLSQLPGQPVVRVILHNGREYLVRNIQRVAPGYVMLEIHPPEGEARGTFRFPPAAALLESASSPIALAYEAIAQVYVQSTGEDQKDRLGFRSS